MQSKIVKYVFLLFLTGIVFANCTRQEIYPVIPEITYDDFVLLYNNNTGMVDHGVLKLSFKDGDGDIGLLPSETDPPYDYNLFIEYYEIRNKDSVHVTNSPLSGDTLVFHARIPILTPKGSNKAIKGEIQDTLLINYPNSEFDTIFYKVYLLDRALHQSNTIYTPLILRNF